MANWRLVKFCSRKCLNINKRLPRDFAEPPSVDGARWLQLGHGEFALVDVDDFERVNALPWTLGGNGYAAVKIICAWPIVPETLLMV
jgi:hypothetical protein